jgi:hypothetical protein
MVPEVKIKIINNIYELLVTDKVLMLIVYSFIFSRERENGKVTFRTTFSLRTPDGRKKTGYS